MTAHTIAGLSTARLERITDLLQDQYVGPGKIAGCQTLVARHGEVAYSRSLGSMDLERAKPWADDTVVRIYFDDQADRVGRAHDALGTGPVPDRRSRRQGAARMARPAGLGRWRG